MRPYQNPVKPLRVLFLDAKTGAGYTSAGHKVEPALGGRRTAAPSLVDILETAASYSPAAQLVILTGGGLKPAKDGGHWTTAATPGWNHGNHWIDGENVTGRYTSAMNEGVTIRIAQASNWFGSVPVNAELAKTAWRMLTHYIGVRSKGQMNLMMSPGKTGSVLWGFAITKDFNPPPLDGYVADLIHATSGQGHIEHLVAGDYAAKHPDCVPLIDPETTPTIDRFTHIDGRFMYASVCKELGVGPVHELRQEAAADLWRETPYAKARYRVSVQVPKDWNHIGILGMKGENHGDGWLYPNRAGARFETWADYRELLVAQRHGWGIQPLEALRFTEKLRPLDTWADWVIGMRKDVEDLFGREYHHVAVEAAMTALRAILLHGIGRFAMRGQSNMVVTDDMDSIPEAAMGTLRELPGGKFSYRNAAVLDERDRPYYHPELAAQVWGWARANVLDTNTKSGQRTGALNVDPSTLIGIETDAIYTTELPRWAAPTIMGGADDGEAGRLRLKGVATGRMKTPATLEERDALKKKADKADLAKVWEGDDSE
jgi:hypothetical protein